MNDFVETIYIKDGWIYIVMSKRISKMTTDGGMQSDITCAKGNERIRVAWVKGIQGNWLHYEITDDDTNIEYQYKVSLDGSQNVLLP